ncbi:MarR family transcriptional regulator [Mycobacterium sp. MS1601]|uniref:MarR family winged helix-turn-helix transcriptional regulator n=1 Tax=Mycobacterium sp. MS1601 TaxID=1936029 RepID=UPI00097966EF|nr:MarR family transcriptional regulator [Mycobacterium sp. MS1601]AQA01606.1 MarR family transcriptional regulator [Mycobacterium sp. MS1601]
MATLRLDDHLCFALYAASRAVAAAYRPLLTEFGITYPQYLVLIVLRDDGAMSVRELGERLQLDSGTLSPLLKRMETAGLLVRQRSELDERSVHVDLTRAGRQLEVKVRCVPERLAELVGDSGWTEADIVKLRDDVNRLTALVRQDEEPDK